MSSSLRGYWGGNEIMGRARTQHHKDWCMLQHMTGAWDAQDAPGVSAGGKHERPLVF